MLDHNAGASMKAQKASMPIARTNGPGYERPERARTSHACEPCRERKTKCDGERPSCRRCLHTGTSCHYGYGKGWRKRKTAEDLNATSKKLQRYEALLNDIAPLVSPEIRAIIEDVRQQEVPTMSPSETMESTSSLSSSLTPTTSMDRDRAGSGPVSRLPLPLPTAGSLGSLSQSRPQTSLPFDRVSGSTSPHLAHHPKREGTFEDTSTNRLPSITPNGVLIENATRDASPNYTRPSISATQTTPDRFTPSTGLSYGSDSPVKHADAWTRPNPSSALGLSQSPHHQLPPHIPLSTHLTA